jgi:hypothetical protein
VLALEVGVSGRGCFFRSTMMPARATSTLARRGRANERMGKGRRTEMPEHRGIVARVWLFVALCCSAGCGASSELVVRRGDVVVPLADASSAPDVAAPRCPSTERLSTARRVAWSTCNNRDLSASCARSPDGSRVCGCGDVSTDAALCGFGLVNFEGSNAILARALCDSRTGICECTISGLTCTCRSSDPSAVCGPRTGRNCCWNESL